VLFTVVIGGVSLYGVRSVREALEQYTSDSALPLDVPPVDSSAIASGASKLAALKKAYSEGAAYRAELSEAELQGIIQSSPWRDKLRVSLAGDEVAAMFSFPLSDLGDWQAASVLFGDVGARALRGDAQGRFEISEGKASLKLSTLHLNKRPLEDMARAHAADWVVGAFNSAVAGNNPPSESNQTPDTLKQIQKIAVQGGRITVQLR
jgi:hypothetical protein